MINSRKNSNEIEKRKRKKNIVMGNAEQNNSDLFETFEKIQCEVSSKDIDFIINSLKGNFLFANLNDTEFEVIISNMFVARVK